MAAHALYQINEYGETIPLVEPRYGLFGGWRPDYNCEGYRDDYLSFRRPQSHPAGETQLLSLLQLRRVLHFSDTTVVEDGGA